MIDHPPIKLTFDDQLVGRSEKEDQIAWLNSNVTKSTSFEVLNFDNIT